MRDTATGADAQPSGRRQLERDAPRHPVNVSASKGPGRPRSWGSRSRQQMTTPLTVQARRSNNPTVASTKQSAGLTTVSPAGHRKRRRRSPPARPCCPPVWFVASPHDQTLVSAQESALVAELQPLARPDLGVNHPHPVRGHGYVVDVAPAARLVRRSCRTTIPGMPSRVWATFFSPGAPVVHARMCCGAG